MAQQDVWQSVTVAEIELPTTPEDYYRWWAEWALRETKPFRDYYRTERARDGSGFWVIEDMRDYVAGRGPLLWVEVAPGGSEGLTRFTLEACHESVSVITLREIADGSVRAFGHRGDCPGEPVGEPGRPADTAYDWAWRELQRGRSEDEVYDEWRNRPDVADRWQQMADAREAFRSAMKRRNNRGTKPT